MSRRPPGYRVLSPLFGTALWISLGAAPVGNMLADEPSAASISTDTLKKSLTSQLLVLNARISEQDEAVELYSRRGDLHFFLGQFPQAVADYQKMVKLDPRQDASHWRLGISLYYNGQYEAAARQFDHYHSHDQIDRENGIWRYFSYFRAFGKTEARKQLLKYTQDDRPPFNDLYQLFSGQQTSRQILNRIHTAPVADQEREKQLFYASLYIGLNSLIESDPASARRNLQAAVENSWPQGAGFGPHYMWHVARLQLQLLNEAGNFPQSNLSTDPSPASSPPSHDPPVVDSNRKPVP